MDVFRLRERVIGDYAEYVQSFFTIRDERIREHVERELKGGALWPEPLVQLSPSFEPGESLDDLVAGGRLHPECRKIFARKQADGTEVAPLRLYRHQVEGVDAARAGDNYVLTTGTGSGKSLSYIVPIVDHVLRLPRSPSIKAIVVYPMNALANSQENELEKYLCRGYPAGQPPVTFRRYTGQESQEARQEIVANPPDILLTNFMMLELLLTRPWDAQLIEQTRGSLRFLVLDELHTYRGRQGADVGLLVRRLREACETKELIHVGTSATVTSGASLAEQQQAVAAIASDLFGAEVKPERVIGETLRRVTPLPPPEAELRKQLRRAVESKNHPPADNPDAFRTHPLAMWVESTLGLAEEANTGRLVRAKPLSLAGEAGAAARLAALTGLDRDACEAAILATLEAGQRNLDAGRPQFAFRLHQFVSRGEAVYASPEPEPERHITLQPQSFVPGSDRTRSLLPVAFCRECGQEYYVVRRRVDAVTGQLFYSPRELSDRLDNDDGEPGYLHISSRNPWPTDDPEAILKRLPDNWLEARGDRITVRRSVRDRLPRQVYLSAKAVEGAGNIGACYFRGPFLFCLECGVTYDAHQTSDFAKLATLGSEGRSTATTIISLGTLRQLRRETDLPKAARKLLSFTDNRQDASLQAGHFNDFVEIALLRAGLRRAVADAGAAGVRHDQLTMRVFEALDLPLELYAANPAVQYVQREETERALREALGYYVYRDLQRGWRITSPNLEQCGLLQIDYVALPKLCRDAALWNDTHAALATAAPDARERICKTLLDHLRRELAIRVSYLDPGYQESTKQLSSQYLIPPWALDDQGRLERGTIVFPRSRGDDSGPPHHLFLSPRGGFGLYLKRPGTLTEAPKFDTKDVREILRDLFKALFRAGLVHEVVPAADAEDVAGYQLAASGLIWRAGEGERAFHDPIRVPSAPDEGLRANRFFADFYRQAMRDLHRLEAREHTAQVHSQERVRREDSFRDARLPILFCSPTMELGVDIAELNVVGLRNVPPTPANYAQRSGRAGRSGQPAFVLTYCAAGSPHDQYFFKHPEAMVAGAVSPPRLDLENEDLLRAHVHSVWLSVAKVHLGSSLRDVLEISGDSPTLAVKPNIDSNLRDAGLRARTRERARAALGSVIAELVAPDGTVDVWLDQVLRELPQRFDEACQRWRGLYRSALAQIEQQSRIIRDASRPPRDRDVAKRLRNEAENQLRLLEAGEEPQSDFYSYRYFAGEGFLPGYNFPRLPLSAYLPGRRRQRDQDDFLSRPRFLAISEFGPRSFIYHEGARYVVNRIILPVTGDGILKRRAVQCASCGYLHPLGGEPGPDLCEDCGATLPPALDNFFRMENVSTRRRDRINSDEEERFRIGYELRTGLRFAQRGGALSARDAVLIDEDGAPEALLRYGHAATLWRMNLGWRRRKNKDKVGFGLDFERGYWARNQEVVDDPPDDLSQRVERVVPYVEDTRNCLVLQPEGAASLELLASLEAALKVAIQLRYQLEDRELGSEPLPSPDDRHRLLFYEASEGGAGVLRRLVEDPTALTEVARKALELCHFDPDTGEDLGHGPGARERCEAACYDCLLSYYNQRDHQHLDRFAIQPLLLRWAKGDVQVSSAPIPRAELHARLARQCASDLERRWLDLVYQRGHRLPTDAQLFLDDLTVRPDLFYRGHHVAIFVDGPPHDTADRKAEDQRQDARLMDAGITPIRFHHQDDWIAILARYPAIFGLPAADLSEPEQPTSEDPPDSAPSEGKAAFDPDDFDEVWHPLLEKLAELGDVTIEPGDEVMDGSRVVDLDLMTLHRDGRSLRLVDAAAPTAAAVTAALERHGEKVLRVRADLPDLLDRILQALSS